ncbi:MAG: ABC transporter permease [Lachnospiraceae bacterium]|nr:ABC transporter permease [Lachnospiraceae bacterium]
MNKKKNGFLNTFIDTIKTHIGILGGLLLMCIVLSIITNSFLTPRNLFNVLRQISVNVFLACGMTMIIILGGIDLSVGSTIAVSGCLCAGLITRMGMPTLLAVLISILAGGVIGLINGLIVSRTTIPPFIVTLATMNIGRGIARVYTQNKTIAVSDPTFSFIGTGYIFGIPIHVIFIVIIVVITSLILNRTQFGRHIYAVGGNKTAAIYAGINASRVTLTVFLLSGLFAGMAGILTASRTFTGQYSLGDGAEMDAITAVVLGGTSMSGGVGTLGGTIIGCMIVGVLNNGMNLLGIDSSWQYIVQGVVVLLAVFIDFFKKRGLKF